MILDTLPPEYDSRVKAMEVDERPTEDYNDIGYEATNCMAGQRHPDSPALIPVFAWLVRWCRGLHKEINELKEAIVLPLTHAHLFQEIGIRPPKGMR